MPNRRMAKEVRIGGVVIGGEQPLAVQTMLSRPAGDIEANVRQAKRVQALGCDILRVSVPRVENAVLVRALKQAVSMPIVADIHFDWRIALASVEAGADKIRINPGNIGAPEKLRRVVEACTQNRVPIRIGVNAGSLEQRLLDQYGHPTPEALAQSAMDHVGLLEGYGFTDIVISIKSSNVPMMLAAYRLLATRCAYPLHLGVTEAGTLRMGLVKNAMGIGGLLLEGIGDTLRVSLSEEPEEEVRAGFDILRAAGHRVKGPEVISCPTCGRTNIPVADIAREVERRLEGFDKPVKVAVMGCVVNGIGEGKEADIGIAGGQDSAVLFVKGRQVRVLRGDYAEQLAAEARRLFG